MSKIQILAVAIAAGGVLLATQANAQSRAPGEWWRTGESRTGSAARVSPRARGPAVAGFRTRRDREFDDQVRYTFGGRGLPTWAARAFEPANRR